MNEEVVVERKRNSPPRGAGCAKKLAKSCAGRKIATTTWKTQFDAMNHKSNGKSQLIDGNVGIVITALKLDNN
jgi:hypothetical protein